jgi:hypothetical protein
VPDNFWKSLRLGFKQLRAECAIDPPTKPAGRLIAIWTARPEPGWRLEHWDANDGNGVIERFKWHAESAAARLHFTGTGEAAVAHWLDRLRTDAPESHVNRHYFSDRETEILYSVKILDICGLSADYCRKCEAGETRFREQQVGPGVSDEWPPSAATDQTERRSSEDPATDLPIERIRNMRKSTRRALERARALELAKSARLKAEAALRKEAADAVIGALPSDWYGLERILWGPLSKYAELVFDKTAEARLQELGPKVSIRRYTHWLQCTCAPAVLEDVCAGGTGQFYQTGQYLDKIIGNANSPEDRARTRRVVAGGILTELLGGEHTKYLEKQLEALLSGRVPHWEAQALDQQSGLQPRPPNPSSTASSLSWQEIRDKFLEGSDEHPRLCACWGRGQEAWTFQESIPDPSLTSKSGTVVARPSVANPKAVELFKATARSAVLLLGDPVDALPPWHVWLDKMRTSKRGFRLQTVSPWSQSRRFLEDGTPIPQSSQRVLKNGRIAHVFKESADFCEDIARAAEKVSSIVVENARGAMFHPKTWDEVEISFFNERTVQITVGEAKPAVRDFGDLGLAHKRSGKATRAWQALHLLAQSEGVISHLERKPTEWRFLEKRMQEIRAWLRALFGLRSDPLPFIKKTGYRAEFKIKRAHSYQK